MSYRVETASSGRAICKATECKDHAIKIEKDDLRLGVWVTYEERGSWAWRHWGCVSGKQLENLRNYLEDPAKPGTYRYDYLDGYEGEEKNSLDKNPDLQVKVRRVIEQGFIDPEDWNGDPEMNKLGETGLFTKEHKRQMLAEKRQAKHAIAEKNETIAQLQAKIEELEADGKITKKKATEVKKLQRELDGATATTAGPASSQVTPKKRVRAEGAEEAESKPPKKRRATKKAKKEETDDEEDQKKAVLAKKGRSKKAKKEESEDDDDKIDFKLEDHTEDEENKDTKRVKNVKTKKGVKKEHDGSDEDDEVMPGPSKRARVKRESGIKSEHDDSIKMPDSAGKKMARGKNAVKAEHSDEDSKPAVKKEPRQRGRTNGKPKAEPESEDKLMAKVEDFGVKGEPTENNGVADLPDVKTNIKDEDPLGIKVNEEKDETIKAEDSEEEDQKPAKKGKKKAAGASQTTKTRKPRKTSKR